MCILLFCTMLTIATYLTSVLQNFTGSGFLIPSMLRIAKLGIGGGVGFFICDPYKYHKVDTPNYSSFKNIVISVSISCRTLLLASIYCPLGQYSSIFLDEFMYFVCFLSSVDCHYFICGDFNIDIDVPCTESQKLLSC